MHGRTIDAEQLWVGITGSTQAPGFATSEELARLEVFRGRNEGKSEDLRIDPYPSLLDPLARCSSATSQRRVAGMTAADLDARVWLPE
jgi:hypothetical protein